MHSCIPFYNFIFILLSVKKPLNFLFFHKTLCEKTNIQDYSRYKYWLWNNDPLKSLLPQKSVHWRAKGLTDTFHFLLHKKVPAKNFHKKLP